MTHIRRSLPALLGLVAGAAIVDRLGLGHSGVGALASWVHALVLGAAALPLLIPAARAARRGPARHLKGGQSVNWERVGRREAAGAGR